MEYSSEVFPTGTQERKERNQTDGTAKDQKILSERSSGNEEEGTKTLRLAAQFSSNKVRVEVGSYEGNEIEHNSLSDGRPSQPLDASRSRNRRDGDGGGGIVNTAVGDIPVFKEKARIEYSTLLEEAKWENTQTNVEENQPGAFAIEGINPNVTENVAINEQNSDLSSTLEVVTMAIENANIINPEEEEARIIGNFVDNMVQAEVVIEQTNINRKDKKKRNVIIYMVLITLTTVAIVSALLVSINTPKEVLLTNFPSSVPSTIPSTLSPTTTPCTSLVSTT